MEGMTPDEKDGLEPLEDFGGIETYSAQWDDFEFGASHEPMTYT